jgi:N-acetylglutamate synthase-like GNAT family acetyltransferase
MKTLRSATKEDHWALQVFLRQANISTIGLEEKIENFIILEEENEGICGTIGIERFERVGLLRSLVIGPSVKQLQLLQMFEHTQLHARKQELEKLYLVTNKIDYIQFFELLNFHPQDIHNAPKTLSNSEYFKEITKQQGSTLMACEL